ncbi:MAG: c-type cytochrome [Pseudomonadota bacterium]
MFDTMTATKITGALCGSLLVFLLGGWVAEIIYHSGGHGDYHEQAWTIPTDEVPAEEVEEVDFSEVMASADASKGERVYGKCRACHKLEDGANGTGPHLYAVVNRVVEAAAGYGYSGALASATDAWTPDALNEFLLNPKGYAPGTSMSFTGLPKIEDRANLIAYLETIGN